MYVDTEVESQRQDIGWMDITYSNITHLIQTVLLGKGASNTVNHAKLDNVEEFA
jgi:hypothetical protein